MSTPVTPTVTAPPTTYPIPAAGDGVTSANTLQFVQPLANAIAWLQSKVPGANPPSALLDLIYPPEVATCDGTTWAINHSSANARVSWVSTGLSAGDEVHFPLNSRLITGMSLAACSVDFIGALSHGALPAVMPTLLLTKTARGFGTNIYTGTLPVRTTIATGTDASANTTAFQLLHSIFTTPGSPEVIDLNAWCYELIVIGESSTNALAGAHIADARVRVSM